MADKKNKLKKMEGRPILAICLRNEKCGDP